LPAQCRRATALPTGPRSCLPGANATDSRPGARPAPLSGLTLHRRPAAGTLARSCPCRPSYPLTDEPCQPASPPPSCSSPSPPPSPPARGWSAAGPPRADPPRRDDPGAPPPAPPPRRAATGPDRPLADKLRSPRETLQTLYYAVDVYDYFPQLIEDAVACLDL